MKDIYHDILELLSEYNAKLVLVSKTKPASQIKFYYDQGQRDFGENRVQEMVAKHEQLPQDIKWHQIGHLQKNKVKYIAPFVHLIHSVDNLDLLVEINKRAIQNNRTIDVLLQIKIAKEDTKFGLSVEKCIELLESQKYKELKNIRITGLMGMATFTYDQEQIKNEFGFLKAFFDKIKNQYFKDKSHFSELSMGMSSDYKIALEQGATIVRIGSLIMGSRNFLPQK